MIKLFEEYNSEKIYVLLDDKEYWSSIDKSINMNLREMNRIIRAINQIEIKSSISFSSCRKRLSDRSMITNDITNSDYYYETKFLEIRLEFGKLFNNFSSIINYDFISKYIRYEVSKTI